MELIEALNWRYAAKKMTGQQVPSQKLNTILEAIRLSASSVGLQPYNIVVIDNPELKELIHEKACTQPQIIEGLNLYSNFYIFLNYSEHFYRILPVLLRFNNKKIKQYLGY